MSSANDVPHLPAQVVAEQTQLQLPSYPHWIEATVEYLRQKAVLAGACQETRSGKLMVALHEALSNAIVHGNLELSSDLKERGDDSFAQALAERVADARYADRTVEILIDANAERCRWVVTDQGPGFDIAAVLMKKLSDDPEVLLASGRGILIMRSFLDDVRYDLGGRRLILTLKRDSGVEKRQSQRVPTHQPLRIAPMLPDGSVDWDAAYQAVSKNFSSEGVSVLQERLAESDRIMIGMVVGNEMFYVPAEIKHCRTLAGDVVELGCRFQTRQRQEEAGSPEVARVTQAIGELLTRNAQPTLPTDDRRINQRVVYTERIDIIPAGAKEPIAGYARDLSRGGIAFITTTLLPEEITIVFKPEDEAQTLRVACQVVRCVKVQDGFYDIGARFVKLKSPVG